MRISVAFGVAWNKLLLLPTPPATPPLERCCFDDSADVDEVQPPPVCGVTVAIDAVNWTPGSAELAEPTAWVSVCGFTRVCNISGSSWYWTFLFVLGHSTVKKILQTHTQGCLVKSDM